MATCPTSNAFAGLVCVLSHKFIPHIDPGKRRNDYGSQRPTQLEIEECDADWKKPRTPFGDPLAMLDAVLSWEAGHIRFTRSRPPISRTGCWSNRCRKAATLTVEGTILFGESPLRRSLEKPSPIPLGPPDPGICDPQSRSRLEALLSEARNSEVQGEIHLQRTDGTTVPVNLGVTALREGALGLCLVITDLTEQAARHKAERLAERIARLQAVTAALSEALTVSEVADVIVSHGLTAINANVAVVSMLANDGREFVNLRVVGYPPDLIASWTSFPADAGLPMADAVRQGCPIVLNTVFEQYARYPELRRWKAIEGDGALVALPLPSPLARRLPLFANASDAMAPSMPRNTARSWAVARSQR